MHLRPGGLQPDDYKLLGRYVTIRILNQVSGDQQAGNTQLLVARRRATQVGSYTLCIVPALLTCYMTFAAGFCCTCSPAGMTGVPLATCSASLGVSTPTFTVTGGCSTAPTPGAGKSSQSAGANCGSLHVMQGMQPR